MISRDAPGTSDAIKVLLLQFGAALVVFALASMQIGPVPALGALFGGAVALLNTQLMVWRMRRPIRGPQLGQQQVRLLYRSVVERFVMVFLLLAAGFKVPLFSPLALVAGFVACQMVWIVYSIMCGIRK